MERKKYLTVAEYLADFSGETQSRLLQLQELVRTQVPAVVVETISYNIPAYLLNKKPVVYFAGYAKFVSMYPIQGEAQTKLMQPYLSGRATARFQHNLELPVAVVSEFIQLRLTDLGSS